MDDDEIIFEGGEHLLAVEPMALDCADVLASIITREFPDAEFELVFMENTIWRPQWRITLPHQTEYSIAAIDDLAHRTMLRLFWRHGVLIPYAIIKESEDADAEVGS